MTSLLVVAAVINVYCYCERVWAVCALISVAFAWVFLQQFAGVSASVSMLSTLRLPFIELLTRESMECVADDNSRFCRKRGTHNY